MPPKQEPSLEERRAQILAEVGAGRVSAEKASRQLRRLAVQQERENLAARRRASRTRWAWFMVVRVTDLSRGRRFTIPLPLPLLWPVIPIAQWGLRFAARHAGDTGGIDIGKIPVGSMLASFLRTGGTGKVAEVTGDDQKKVEVWIW